MSKEQTHPIITPADIGEGNWETIEDFKTSVAKTTPEKLEMLRKKINEIIYWKENI